MLGLSFLGNFTYGQDTIADKDSLSITKKQDTTAIVSDTISASRKDSVAIQKSDLETTIVYSADDSIIMDVINKIVYLYGNSKVTYGTISLDADRIEINWSSNLMSAYPSFDSTGKKFGVPVFREGPDTYIADTIRYNAKSKKGIIKGVVTKQGDGIIHGSKIKKVEDDIYISEAKYTTCNLAHPHFYINAHKLKVIPQDKIVSGPFHLVIADVPTPLGFPLGFFPVPKRRKSGFIMPTFGSQASRGFYLRQGGYYWAFNQYLGIQAVGDVYSNGSFRANAMGTYRSRYKFQGSISFSYSQAKNSFDRTEPFAKDLNFQWTHATLKKNNSNLTANVNAGTSGYFKHNTYNPTAYQQGVFSSTVIYYKAFGSSPFNINAALRQDQNITSGIMNFTLPDVTFNMNRVYPFKTSSIGRGIGSTILNNFYVQYTGNTKFFITNDSNKTGYSTTLAFNGRNLPLLIKKSQYGLMNTLPIGTTMKFKKTFLKYFNISPGATIQEWMYPYRLKYRVDTTTNKVVADTTRGFYNLYSYTTSLTVNTNIYGMYKFHSKKLLGIRHTVNPIISYRYSPDFTGQTYQNVVQSDTSYGKYYRYTNFLYGAPAGAKASIIDFTINNIIEGKTASKKDTITGTNKFKILDQLTIHGFYNFLAPTNKLSVISISGRTRILNIFDVFGSTTLDPYYYQLVNGTLSRTNRMAVQNSQGLFNVLGYNLSIGANFNPKARKKYQNDKIPPQDLAYINSHPEMYVDFNIPWTLRASLNINYNKSLDLSQPNSFAKSLTFNGDIRITEKWKITYNSGFDFRTKQLTTTQLSVFRDLHCWQMSFNVVPFGYNRSYGFSINAKSSILQTLKLSKKSNSYFGNYY